MIKTNNAVVRLLERSPALPRVVPFLIFIGLTFFQGKLGETSRYWFYLVKTGVGAWLVWSVRPLVAEMRWKWSGPAVGAGIAVFILWVGLDEAVGWLGLKSAWFKWDEAAPAWNPHAVFGLNSALAWSFIGVRLIGSTWVVPPLEEVFYRSFVYRYLGRPDFQQASLGQFSWTPFLVTSALFGSTHNEWLAGLLAGFALQGLVCRKQRLGDAMAAHAITNFLLSLWVVWRGAWHFW